MILSHRHRVVAGFAVVLLTLALAGAGANLYADRHYRPASAGPPAAASSPPTGPGPRQAAPRPPLPDVSSPKVWASWALLHIDTGEMVAGGEPGHSTTESMIKVGIAADVLHGLELENRDPSDAQVADLIAMIRDSDNAAAERLYRSRGRDAVLQRLIRACALHETTSKPGWWSETQMSAADAARLGACIAEGKVASPAWIAWVLEQMRGVTGVGRFGIVESRPFDRGRPLAIKNGWTLRPDGWHVSCLAIADWWTLAVMVRYPADLGLVYGAGVCADVAAALLDPETETPPAPAL